MVFPPLPTPSAAELSATVPASGRWVECVLGDFTSVARGKRVHRDDFIALAGCKLPSVVLGLTLTAGEPDEVFGPLLCTGYGDMALVPDLATLVPRHGRPGEYSVICEPVGALGAAPAARCASSLSPRAALRGVLARYAQAGLAVKVAPELELFLLSREGDNLTAARAQPHSPALERGCEAFSLERSSHFEAYFDALYAACETQGIALNGHAHESAWSQYEVNFRPGEPLAQADAVFRFKRLARELAARHGFLASFAPKPFLHQPGTGMHWHVSVQRLPQHPQAHLGPHLFGLPDGGEAPALGHFIAGLQAHADAAMALFAPFDMSFERIRLSDASPSHASWGHESRSLAFRIPACGSAAGRRVENRLPGGDANPYLTLAATLGLGWQGLQAGQPPQPGAGRPLPTRLPEALAALQASTALRELLGEALVQAYVGIKRHEHLERAALADPRQAWDLVHLVEQA